MAEQLTPGSPKQLAESPILGDCHPRTGHQPLTGAIYVDQWLFGTGTLGLFGHWHLVQ